MKVTINYNKIKLVIFSDNSLSLNYEGMRIKQFIIYYKGRLF